MARKQHRYHFIYKTTNIVNGKYYVGMHSTSNLEDGYIGSGKRLWHSIQKHGKENHKMEILEFVADRESLKLREREIVCEDFLKDPMCMNLQLGGGGGFLNEEHQQKVSDAAVKSLHELHKNPEWLSNRKATQSQAMKDAYENGMNPRGFCSEETRKEMCRRAVTPEANAKRSKTMKDRGHNTGEKHYLYGKKLAWVNKDGIRKQILEIELDDHLSDGWIRGLGPRKNK